MKRTEARLILLVGVVLLLCGVTGGSNFILIKALVGQISPLQLTAGRVALAGLVLGTGLFALQRLPRMNATLLQGAAILAVIDAVLPYVLIASAASHILASTSALLVSTMPLFTALFVSATDRTRVPSSALVGLAIGAVGVSILAGPTAIEFGRSATLAMVAVLLAAASYAAAAVYSRVLLRAIDPIGLSTVKFAIASVILVPVVAFYEGLGDFKDLTLTGWLGLLGIGILATGLARCGYVWVISVAGSVTASLLTYIVPAAALLLGWLLVNETMSWTKGVGAAMIGASVTCVLFGQAVVTGAIHKHLAVKGPRQRIQSA